MWWSDNLSQGLVSEFVEYVGGGVGVSGRGKPEEVREST